MNPQRNSTHAASPDRKVSTLAGTWYEADARRLAAGIDDDLRSAAVPDLKTVRAVILPHAGYRFSGRIAAQGAVWLGRRALPRRILLLGPTHRVALRQRVALPSFGTIETPLGSIPVDRDAIDLLAASPFFEVDSDAFADEHSVEIQLPILQRVVGDFTVIPLVVGQLDTAGAAGIAHVLSHLLDDHTDIVVSSDFTHYGMGFRFRPFHDRIPENIRQLDDGAVAAIMQHDPAAFHDYCERTGATICGRHPITVLLAMLPPDAAVHRVAYTTSGDLTGDYSHCVSYLAAAVSLPGGWPRPRRAPGALNASDRQTLLRLARHAIDYHLDHDRPPEAWPSGTVLTAALRQERGAFVSLHLPGHRLRGCIGEIIPRRPLCEAVAGNAIQAAFHDPRFPPLSRREGAQVTLEISALTPPRPIAATSEIVLGRDGIVMEKSGAGAVFLPQVAPEQQWTLDETLTQLALKAGLPADAWQSAARFTVFEADVFR